MIESLKPYTEKAIALLHDLATPYGFLASSIPADNYQRIWARDSVVCGMAGWLLGDAKLLEGLKNSLLLLAKHQHELGMIPSNVKADGGDVSMGSLVGRIDANTWFIIGACEYYRHTQDNTTWTILKPAVQKCRDFLKSVEFNAKGWIYTPMSGNWADEYPTHGYTLYDNVLRWWGETLWQELEGPSAPNVEKLKSKIEVNFWPKETIQPHQVYHKTAYDKVITQKISHYIAFILPGIYDIRFDAAGNGLALMNFQLDETQKRALSQFIAILESDLSRTMIPAFWPIVESDHPDWQMIQGNYSYDFKNHSGSFHNGGIWPVWMGLFCMGLARNGMQQEVKKLVGAFIQTVSENSSWDFHEYFNAYSLKPGGKTKMGYTASGIVFMQMALQNDFKPRFR